MLGACKVLSLPLLASWGCVDNKHLAELKRMIHLRRGACQLIIDMCVVGVLRAGSISFGLIALRAIAASFMECIKSSQPPFTVFFAFIMLGQTTRWYVVLSLLPVVFGLGLASGMESSFTWFGLAAAMLTNVLDVVQNVYSKKLLSQGSRKKLRLYKNKI